MELKVSQQAEKLSDTWTRETETVHTLTYFTLENCSVHFQHWGEIQTPKEKRKKGKDSSFPALCIPRGVIIFALQRDNFAIWVQMWVSSREGKTKPQGDTIPEPALLHLSNNRKSEESKCLGIKEGG